MGMPRDFELRLLTHDDAEAMGESVRDGFESFRAWAPEGWDPPAAVSHPEELHTALARPTTWGLLASEGGRVAGHAAFTQAVERSFPPSLDRQGPRTPIPGLAHLWQLFVRRPWWGTGLATELNRRIVAEAAAQGYEAIRLLTPAGSARGRAFYEREGWETDGIQLPEPALGLDLVLYRRRLP